MPLTSSGAISLNEIHIEAGGSSGTSCTINDSDIRALIDADSGAELSFDDWYGASAMSAAQHRGILGGGETGTPWSTSSTNVIEFVTINSAGNASDFGDLTAARQLPAGHIASATRGVFTGGSE